MNLEQRTEYFWRLRGEGRLHVFVAWYLMASVAYYQWNETFIPDDDFDLMCFELYKAFDQIVHPHKHLLSRDALLAGTAFHLNHKDYPLRTRQAAWSLLYPNDRKFRRMPSV